MNQCKVTRTWIRDTTERKLGPGPKAPSFYEVTSISILDEHHCLVKLSCTSVPALHACPLTIFDLCNVSDDDVGHFDLDHLPPSHHSELLFLLNATLEAAELLLFAPVVESGHQDYAHHREQDGGTFDPSSLRVTLLLKTACCFAAVWTETTRNRVLDFLYNISEYFPELLYMLWQEEISDVPPVGTCPEDQ